MKNLVDTYDELIGKSSTIEVGHCGDVPEVTGEILTPESDCIIKEDFIGYKVTFKADKNGMEEILSAIDIDGQHDLIEILHEICNKIYEYFGGYNNADSMDRMQTYMDYNYNLLLSQIKGKHIGQCAEKAVVAHNILKTIKALDYIISFDSRFITSKLNGGPHAFILLENIAQNDGQSFIFDIENPSKVITNDNQELDVIGLYPISRNQLDEFYKGKSINLKCIFDGIKGWHEVGKNRYYGNDDVQNQTQNISIPNGDEPEMI